MFWIGNQVGKVFKVHHDGWPWPTFSRSFFSRLYLGNHLTYRLHILHGEPGYQGLQVASWWVTLTYFLKATLLQVISWEPLDLQSSYFVWGTKLPWSLRCSMMGDLDLLSQGHPSAGYSLRTIWPTDFIFCMGNQVTKVIKLHHDGWPWPTFSRPLFYRSYLENRWTYRAHIFHGGPSYQGLQNAWWWVTLTRSRTTYILCRL
jgi:hypothetical protein